MDILVAGCESQGDPCACLAGKGRAAMNPERLLAGKHR